jgi:pimeloyl-ACP methyl ester carboxylesterase/DNA-binding SARP family transcriptional activator
MRAGLTLPAATGMRRSILGMSAAVGSRPDRRCLSPAAGGGTILRGSAEMTVTSEFSVPDAPPIEIRLLGGLSVMRRGQEAALPPSRKTRALLAFLAAAERPVRRERLCEMFWEVPDDPKGALRWSLSRLRQSLGDAIEANREVVSLRRDRVAVDYDALRRPAAVDPANLSIEAIEALAGLFRGGFLDDLSLPRCPEYEAWRTAIANELQLARLRLLRGLVDRLRDEPERALPYANALRTLNPEDESLGAEVEALAEACRRRVLAQPAAPASETTEQRPAAIPPPAMRRQEIRYIAGFDGIQLACAVTGEGYPLLKCGNWMSDLQYDQESSVWAHWIAGLAARNTLIRYDQRGNGLSDREVDDVSFAAQLADLEAVADAACPERFALLGISAGAALSAAYAARHPERVSHLILYGGRERGWRLSGTPEEQAYRAAMVNLIRSGWGRGLPAFHQLFTSLFIPEATQEQMDWYNELQQRTVSPDTAARLHEANGLVDVSDILGRITAPTLVMHASGDVLVPFDRGRELAIGIRGARFVSLDSRNHILLSHEPAFRRFLEELWRFVDEPTEASA